MFLLVPAYPGCPGSKAVKRSLLLLLCPCPSMFCHCWFGIRKSIQPGKLSDVLVWLSVSSDVQIVCMWSSWCHCIPKTHHLMPHLNPYCFTFLVPVYQVVPEKRPGESILKLCISVMRCSLQTSLQPRALWHLLLTPSAFQWRGTTPQISPT